VEGGVGSRYVVRLEAYWNWTDLDCRSTPDMQT
jgi:hypothetical protein